MTTSTTRERFEEKFYRIAEDECIISKNRDDDGCFEKSDLDDVWSFLEKEIAEAEKRMKEKCLNCIPEKININYDWREETIDEVKGRNQIYNEIRYSLSQL